MEMIKSTDAVVHFKEKVNLLSDMLSPKRFILDESETRSFVLAVMEHVFRVLSRLLIDYEV